MDNGEQKDVLQIHVGENDMAKTMEPLKPLMDSIFIEKALRTRRRPIDEKMLDGPKLFEDCCLLMRSGIRSQFPDYTAEQFEKELRRRLEIRRRINEAGIYKNVGILDE